MDNLDFYNRVRSVPEEAKKKINAGRIKGMTDINPMWRIKKLTEEFGMCGIGWYYTVTKKWLETSGHETAAFVDIELYVKISGEWSKAIPGTGGSKFITQEKNGVYVSDECFKMATTDALSVACKQLGIGADVYFEKDLTKYSTGEQPSDRKINQKEIEKLESEADRTGMNIPAALKSKGWKKIGDVTLSVYTVWMRTMKERESIPKPAPDGAVEEPPEGEADLPFR